MTDGQGSPPPAADLDTALAQMRVRVEPGRFALLGLARAPRAADLALLQPPCQLTFEGGELSLLLPAAQAEALLASEPHAQVARDLCWVRFELAMQWEVVGFLARVTGALAAAGVPLGAVCGYSRDHLFVHERYLDTCVAVLDDLLGGH